jgi:hypothetical protein
MSNLDVLEKAKREVARWRILKVLDAGRPGRVNEQLILLALNDAEVALTQTELRRELDYLRDRKLVTVHGEQTPTWTAELTHYGVDLVEYTVDVFPGIARPPRW